MLSSIKKNFGIAFLLLFSYFTFIGFGLHHLTDFVNIDEHFWLQERIPQYWDALASGKIKKTRINDKPGVTVAVISGIGLLFEKNPAAQRIKDDPNLSAYDVSRTKYINFVFRLPILILNSFLIFYAFWVLRKITNIWTALWFSSFIATSPILIGITQFINPDSFLWSFSIAALLSFFAFLKTQQNKFAVLTAIFLGLALLSKYTAAILLPFLFVFSFVYFLFLLKNKAENKELPGTLKAIRKTAFANFLIIGGSMLVFSILMPAVFLKPKHLFFGTIGYPGIKTILIPLFILNALIIAGTYFIKDDNIWEKMKKLFVLNTILRFFVFVFLPTVFLFILLNWILGQRFINLEHIPFDTRQRTLFSSAPLHQKVILEFLPLVFSLPPLVLGLLLFLWVKSLIKPIKENFYFVLTLSFFLIIFHAAMIFSDLLTTIRYSIIIYPVILLLAALSVSELCASIKATLKIKYIFSILIIFFGIINIALSSPFYFNYTTDLLPKKYIITGAAGYGGYEAVEFLNALPDAKNLTVWSDYHGVCEFFVGKCITKYKFNRNNYPIDYYVLTRRGRVRYNFASADGTRRGEGIIDAYAYYDRVDPVWQLQIDNRPQNYIKVFKSQDR